MIRPSRGAVAALLSLVVLAAPAAAQSKIAYVDTRKILQEMPGRNQVEARYRTEVEALQAREKVMVDSLNALVSAFERDSAAMTAAQRTERFGKLQAFDGRYRDTLQALQAEAQQKQGEMMQPLFDQIKIALEDVRRAEGLAMIFDMGAQVNPVVAMDKNLDLSDKVIAKLRTMPAVALPSAAPAATRPPAAAPGAAPAAPARPAGPVTQPAGVRRP